MLLVVFVGGVAVVPVHLLVFLVLRLDHHPYPPTRGWLGVGVSLGVIVE